MFAGSDARTRVLSSVGRTIPCCAYARGISADITGSPWRGSWLKSTEYKLSAARPFWVNIRERRICPI
jgi:hypothetical protein